MKLSQYLRYLTQNMDSLLFDEDCRRVFERLATALGDIESQETIQEIELSMNGRQADYSCRLDKTDRDAILDFLRQSALAQSSVAWRAVADLCSLWGDEQSGFSAKVSNVWLEMDYEPCLQGRLEPCVFFDISQVQPQQEHDWIYPALTILL